MADYLVQEDGSRFTLEDDSGFLLLETIPELIGRGIRVVWQAVARRTAWRIGRRIKWR